MAKSFFIDLTRCTGCRGCQVACKQWKNLPAEDTSNTGVHTNPPDLSSVTYKTVHMVEEGKGKSLQWHFFPEQCRHCTEPPCMGQADVDKEGAVIQDAATGAVLFTELTAEVDGQGVREACPYNIPRLDPKTKRLHKCDMCIDRVREGKEPACVQTCPTGCMNFGEDTDMQALAKERLAEVKKKHPDAVLGDADSVLVIYLFEKDPKLYHAHAVADASPVSFTRQQLFAKVRQGFSRVSG
ncbi:MAG: 4Fe-4S dicluster domain-containing protein [Desulfovibrionaceae bacterium]